MRSALIVFAGAAILILVGAFYQLSHRSGRAGEETPIYSARRFDPWGTAALREVLESRGVDVQTVDSPRLPTTGGGVLLRVLPQPQIRMFFGNQPGLEVSRMEAWLERGNKIVQLSRSADALIEDHFNVREADAKNLERRQRAGVHPKDLLKTKTVAAGRYTLSVLVPSVVDGKSIVGRAPVGGGQLVYIASPSPALNAHIAKADNLDFLLSELGEGPVYIDEWSHGLGAPPGVMRVVVDMGLMPFVLQLLFLLAFYVWHTRGYPHRELSPSPRARSTREQIGTLGHLYQHVLRPDEILTRTRREALQRMARVLRTSPDALSSGQAKLSEPDRAAARVILAQTEPHALLTSAQKFCEERTR